MIDPGHPRLSIVRQCELASISRSSFYRERVAKNEETLRLMRRIDEQFLETPWYGSRQMARHLRRQGWRIGRHRVRRLMLFDSAGIYAKPTWDTALFTSTTPEQLHKFYALLMPIPPQVPGFVVRDILRSTKKRSWITQRALGSMLAGRDVTDSLLPQLKMPVLIVWGELDRITPLSQGEKIHELIPQSQLEVIPGCGHLAPSQCATRIGPKVVEFVKQ